MKRDEVAHSLWAALNLPSWQIDNAQKFDNVKLPVASSIVQRITSYALNQVGYPYIWSGEWNAVSPPGYCCGYQPQGGFDCSGFVWWVLKKNEGGYNAAQFRTYRGWPLPQRSSYEIAEFTRTKLTWAQLKPGNVMTFSSNGSKRWQDVTHVGIYRTLSDVSMNPFYDKATIDELKTFVSSETRSKARRQMACGRPRPLSPGASPGDRSCTGTRPRRGGAPRLRARAPARHLSGAAV